MVRSWGQVLFYKVSCSHSRKSGVLFFHGLDLWTDTGQLSTVTAPGSKVWDFDYNAIGQTTQYSHPNGLDSVFSYDGGNRMTKIELKDTSTVVESFLYALDKMACMGNMGSGLVL